MAESSYDVHRDRLRPGRLRRRDPRRPARQAHGRGRARQGRRALPELRVHPGQGGAALGRPAHRDPRGRRLRRQGRRPSRSTTPPSRRAARRSSTTLTGGRRRACSRKTASTLIEGDARAHRRRRRAGPCGDGDEQVIGAGSVILATGSVPRGDPRRRARRPRDRHRGGVGAARSCPRASRSSAAGASGAEIASGFARLGSEVILLEALDRVLPTEDADISRLVERGLKRQGIDVHTGTPVGDVQPGESGVTFTYGEQRARGRLPRDRRRSRRRRRGARARGGGRRARRARPGQGRRRAAHLARRRLRDRRPRARARRSPTRPPTRASSPPRTSPGLQTHPIAYVDIPRATFCTPNVGSFGLTEAQAREQGHDVVVGKVPYGAVGGGTVYGDRTGLVKIVGESALRRAARRPHRRLARDRADPGAGQRARARGRLPRGRRASSTATRRCPRR